MRSIGILASCTLGALASAAQTAGTDNRDGRWVLLEEGPVHPMELSPDKEFLWVANIADATVSVVELSTGTIVEELGAALGPVTLRARPGADEMWVVCQSSGAVLIYEASTRKLLDSVQPGPVVGALRLGARPCGLVFTQDGARAFVTLGATDQIVPIDAATRTQGTPVDFASPFLPVTSTAYAVQEPRALTLVDDTLYALSFESGNGTGPLGNGILISTIRDMWADFASSITPFPPPDRDVLSFDVSGGTLSGGTTALWRMGTVNFDIDVRPETTVLYVSNVDLHNTLLGEHQFSVGGNAIASHRVTYAAPWDGVATPPQSFGVIDLNVDKSAGLEDERFATPNEMVFNSAGNRLYVACYESRTTAVIDVVNDLVIASLQASGAGPRGVLLDEGAGRLYVYNRADHQVDEFDVSSISAGSILSPIRTLSAGYDGTPLSIKQGRKHHINAANSMNQLQSCNVCHIDGHFDRLAWDLGEFTGPLTPPHPQPEAKDAKGVKVTMSLRGIEETAPYHWRGDREDLIDFNPAFEGLLGGSQLTSQQFAEFQDFIFALSYPPNPRQAVSRVMTSTAEDGKGHFSSVDVLRPLEFVNPNANGVRTCVECHSLNGFSGTNNQVNSDLPGNHGSFTPGPVFADDAAQLRGMFDKESATISYPGLIYPTLHPTLTELGSAPWGFLNSGAVPSVAAFVAAFPALVGGGLVGDVVQFLDEFDSGLAPATAFGWTLTQAKAGVPSSSPVLRFLLPQRAAGNCDAVCRGWTVDSLGARVPLRMDFDPAQGQFVTGTPGFGPYTYAQLDALALLGNGVFCFLGAPVGSGRRLGHDRDLDFWPDGDEAAYGALSSSTDTDLDFHPDGYEIRLGSDPSNPASTPVDGTAPNISGLSVVWVNSNTAKIRWTTDEESTTKITLVTATGPVALNRSYGRRGYDLEHVVRVRGLHPGHTYTATVEARNPAGDTSFLALTPNLATQGHEFSSAHVDSVSVSSFAVGAQVFVVAAVRIVDNDELPLQNATTTVKFVEWNSSSGPFVLGGQTTSLSDALGWATVTYAAQSAAGLSTTVEAIAEHWGIGQPQTMSAGAGGRLMHFHPLEKDFSDKLTF